MQLSCIHCGNSFTITKEQLGGRGHCPHCRGEIQLPQADSGQEEELASSPPGHWWENTVSGLVSVVVHIVLMLILALITFGAYPGRGEGEDVMIGELPSEQLTDTPEEELSLDAEAAEPAEEEFEDMLEVEIAEPQSEADVEELTEMPFSSATTDSTAFDWQPSAAGGAAGGGGGWDGLLRQLRQDGLDIVITFDSTSSMGPEIKEVKEQIRRIGTTLFKMIPKTRISICTYRDRGEAYVARGLPLSSNLQEIEEYLAEIRANGGGDIPEAVDEGLNWAVQNNRFRRDARKVILLFGDAPPHKQYLEDCLRTAADFQRQEKGIVSTVTCRSPVRMREFEKIAQMGGGEAFLASDEQQIMKQLMILVFGSRHRSKVLEAFELMER